MLQRNLSCAFEDQVKHLFPYILLSCFAQKKVSRAFITKAKTQPKTKLISYVSKQNDEHYLKELASSLPPQPL